MGNRLKLIIMPWGGGHIIGVEPENASCSGAIIFQPLFYFDSWETFRVLRDLLNEYYLAHKGTYETAIPKAIEEAFSGDGTDG